MLIKPDWLPWDLILILITSVLILIAHICELADLKLFNKIRIVFFISISIIIIVAVSFQIHKSYKQDFIITDFEIHMDLQIIHSNRRKNNLDKNFIRYNTPISLIFHRPKPTDRITFNSDPSNTLFAQNRMIGTKKSEPRTITSVQLTMKPTHIFTLYEKNIDVFKDLHNFIFITGTHISNLIGDTKVHSVRVRAKIYMNRVLRSSFEVSSLNQEITVDKNNSILRLKFNIKKHRNLFHLLKNKIKLL